MNQIATIATVIIIARQAIGIWHGQMHTRLAVGLEPWQQVFVNVVIGVLPLVALILYWTRFRQTGALLLALSMLAGMLFGVYFHFIADTADHVSHLPHEAGRIQFIVSAILLAPVEIAGTLFGFWSWAKFRRAGSPIRDFPA